MIAQTFIDFFAKLGEIHSDDKEVAAERQNLFDARISEHYAPAFPPMLNVLRLTQLIAMIYFLIFINITLSEH